MAPPARLPRTPQRGFALVDLFILLLIIAIIVLIAVLMAPRFARRDGWRTICAANLKGIGTGMYTYAHENADMWPIADHAPAIELEKGQVTYAPGKIGTHRGKEGDFEAGRTTQTDAEMSTTRNLWMLVRVGASTPRSLICPASRDRPNEDDNPQDFWDFRSYQEVSYGYQVPYGKLGRPSSDRDQRMPLTADKGPFGAALEAGAANPGAPTPGSNDKPAAWKPWNSPNHSGEGQCVLFVDAHAEFLTTPIVGVENDNIYTRWSDAVGGTDAHVTPRIHGTPPTSNETPWSDTDTLIYP